MDKLDLASALSLLEDRVKQLLEERSAMRHELEFIRKENTDLKAQLEKKSSQINNFQNQIKISKIVDKMAVKDDTAELKDKINEYIKDIDKCIALLSS